MSKIILLVDWKYREPFFLEDQLKRINKPYELLDIPDYNMKDRIKKIRIFNLYFKYIKLAWHAAFSTTSDDIIICWNFTTSIALGVICNIFRKKRKILALNIIAPERKGVLGNFRNGLFKSAMRSSDFYITVNSQLLAGNYADQFNISEEKFFELPDPVQSNKVSPPIFNQETRYVFCGGEAKRDWDTLFKACNLTPEIHYIVVAREKYFNKKLNIPSNVKLYFDINKIEFNKYLTDSYLVALPLTSKVPAGLIILIQAALSGVPVIATDTASIRNYIINEKTGLLIEVNDYEKLAENIDRLFNNVSERNELAMGLQNYLIDHYSPDKYGDRLINILKNLNWLNN